MLDINAPIIFALEVTDSCNLDCPPCSNVFEKKQEHGKILLPEQWGVILEKIKPYAAQIRITGGEPVLYPQFFELMELVNNLRVYFHIFTNGLWDDAAGFMKQMKKYSYFSSFLISFHGLEHASFSRFSGKNFTENHLRRIVENIRYAARCGYDVSTNTVLHTHNFIEIERLVEFLTSLGVKNIVFERYIGKNIPFFSLTDEQLKSSLSKINRLRGQGLPVTYGNCIPQCFSESSSGGCTAGVGFGTIDPRGNVKPCSHSTALFGNILENSMENIWKGKTAKKWRRNIPAECFACKFALLCAGACRAQAELRGQKKDSLITGTVFADKGSAPPQVTLDDDLMPQLGFSVRKEDKGRLIINKYNNFLFVNDKSFRIIDFISNGRANLREVESRFGKSAISFLYALYVKDFISFAKPEKAASAAGAVKESALKQ